MTQGLLALLGRSLRTDSRSWLIHILRLLLALSIYTVLVYVSATSAKFGAPGLRFFQAFVWLNTIFLTLAGIGFFSTTISEEKEEETLGLMKMAGINPLGILLGKLGGRLFQSFLLIMIELPFMMLAVTLGGVTTNQVCGVFLGLIGYLSLLAGLGVLCSTVAPSNRQAASLTSLALLMWTLGTWGAIEIHRRLTQYGILSSSSFWSQGLEGIGSMSIFLRIGEILTSSFNESPWSIQVVSNLILGGLCFALSWGVFSACTEFVTTERTSRGLLAQVKSPLRWFSPGRPFWNPFFWKDFFFAGGGYGMILTRAIGYSLLIISIMIPDLVWYGFMAHAFHTSIQYCLVALLILVFLEISILSARVIHDEVRGQTLVSLVMLPHRLWFIVYSKLAGALLSAWPGAVWLLGLSAGTTAGRFHAGEFLQYPAGYFFLSHFLLAAHLSAVAALSLRWGCVPLGIGGAIASLFGIISIFESNQIGPHHQDVWYGTVGVSLFCLACHGWVIWRLPLVAARG